MGEILFSDVRVTKIWKESNYIWNYWLQNWKKKQNVGLDSYSFDISLLKWNIIKFRIFEKK